MRRALGGIGMALGILGIVISLAMIVGIWAGRGAVSSQLASISAVIDGRLQRVDIALDALTRRLDMAQGRVKQASANAMQLGQGPDDGPVVDALKVATDQLADEYADMRESFATAREGIADTRELLEWAGRRLPMLPIPQLPGDRLQALDQKLRDLQASLTQVRTDLSTRQGPVAQLRDRVVTAMNTVATGIGEITSQVSDVNARVEEARTSLAETQATAERWVTAAAIVASLLCLYGVLVNLCLFVIARAWFRPPAATPVAA